MNQLKTTNTGGLPFVLDDLRWVDTSVRTAFKGIMSAFNAYANETLILSGCQRTVVGGIVNISAGYVSIGGEVCAVPDHAYPEPTGSDIEYWNVATSFDPNGLKVFQNATTVDTYEVRLAKVNVAASFPAGYSLYDPKITIHYWIAKNYVRAPWTTFKTEVIDPLGVLPGTYLWKCKKDLDGFIHLNGMVRFEDIQANDIIATLPIGFRPPNEITQVVAVDNDTYGSTVTQLLTIEVNGNMKFKRIAGLPFIGILNIGQVVPFIGV